MPGIRTSGGGGGDTSAIYDTTGTILSGTDGTTGRILTLNNTSLSKNEMVSLDGNILADTSTIYYSISNLSANTTITFTVPVWNSQPIRVLYFI